MSDSNDHDTLTKLVQSVDDFHAEMRRSMDELKNNYSRRLSVLETSSGKQGVLLTIGSGLLLLLTSVVIYRILKT
jgi:hypothetical protein